MTLREHLEAIRAAAVREPRRVEIVELSIAALAILDDAARVDAGPLQHALEQFRLVPDPEARMSTVLALDPAQQEECIKRATAALCSFDPDAAAYRARTEAWVRVVLRDYWAREASRRDS